jgi:hypothetical protein
MNKATKLYICFLFIAIAFLTIVQLAEATTMNFTVPSGEEETKTINLAVEDHVLIKFTVVGTSDNFLHFYITYPNGTVKDFGKRGYFHHSFVCDTEGECILRFSNIDSTEGKHVTLDYEVEHYIFGISQMLFLTIIIVTVCMAAVATFILMGKPR